MIVAAVGVVLLGLAVFAAARGLAQGNDASDGDYGFIVWWIVSAASAVVGALLILAASSSLRAAPPADADPALAPWFQGLTLDGVSCCSLSDCRPVPVRVGAGGWEAHVIPGQFPGAEDDLWVEIPADKIIRGKAHPHGLATMCWTPTRGVMCFTEPPGA